MKLPRNPTFTFRMTCDSARVVFHYRTSPWMEPPYFCQWVSNIDDSCVTIDLIWKGYELEDYTGIQYLPVEVEYALRALGLGVDL